MEKGQPPKSLIGDLLTPGDIVLLITPIDSEAPPDDSSYRKYK